MADTLTIFMDWFFPGQRAVSPRLYPIFTITAEFGFGASELA